MFKENRFHKASRSRKPWVSKVKPCHWCLLVALPSERLRGCLPKAASPENILWDIRVTHEPWGLRESLRLSPGSLPEVLRGPIWTVSSSPETHRKLAWKVQESGMKKQPKKGVFGRLGVIRADGQGQTSVCPRDPGKTSIWPSDIHDPTVRTPMTRGGSENLGRKNFSFPLRVLAHNPCVRPRGCEPRAEN